MLIVREAFPDEVLASIWDLWFGREDDLSRIKDGLVLKDGLLGFVMAEGLLTE